MPDVGSCIWDILHCQWSVLILRVPVYNSDVIIHCVVLFTRQHSLNWTQNVEPLGHKGCKVQKYGKRCTNWCMLFSIWINPVLLFCSTNTVYSYMYVTGSYAMADVLFIPLTLNPTDLFPALTFLCFGICHDFLIF